MMLDGFCVPSVSEGGGYGGWNLVCDGVFDIKRWVLGLTNQEVNEDESV